MADTHLPADRVWSFSSITTFIQCPLAFKYQYKDGLRGIANGFSDFGTFVHGILEGYAKGDYQAEDCAPLYKTLYASEVTAPYPRFPKGIKEKSYDRGAEYFEEFSGFQDILPGGEVLYTEQNLTDTIGPYAFRGIVDLVLKSKDTGEVCIIDHKTKSDSSLGRELDLYKKQLYLYAHLYLAKHGEVPDSLAFNLPNSQRKRKYMVFPFDEQEYQDALDWAEQTITGIYLADAMGDYPGNYDYFFCTNLCGVRDECAHKAEQEADWASDDASYF